MGATEGNVVVFIKRCNESVVLTCFLPCPAPDDDADIDGFLNEAVVRLRYRRRPGRLWIPASDKLLAEVVERRSFTIGHSLDLDAMARAVTGSSVLKVAESFGFVGQSKHV